MSMDNYIFYKPIRGKEGMKQNRFLSDEERFLIQICYSELQTELIAKYLKRNIGSIYNHAYAMGLKKSEDFNNSIESGRLLKGQRRGIGTEFKKGQSAFNKGKKQQEWMSRESIKRSIATRFKKGNKPHNTKYDGCITVHYDKLRSGQTIPYKWIRLSERNWKMLHVFNWEKKYGKVPKGKIVVFKNKNSENCDVENLELITREENMRRNTIHRFPEELKSTIRALSKLKKTIHGTQQN